MGQQFRYMGAVESVELPTVPRMERRAKLSSSIWLIPPRVSKSRHGYSDAPVTLNTVWFPHGGTGESGETYN